MSFRKSMLISYYPSKFQNLNAHGWVYILTFKESSWWGLFNKIKTYQQTVGYNQDADKYYKSLLNRWITQKIYTN